MGLLADVSRGRLTDVGLSDRLARALSLVGPDYDYSKQQGALDFRLHGSDLGKLPNHPTFSDQSYYNAPGLAGGQWGEHFNQDGKLVQSYTPSLDMIRSGSTQGLSRYMQRAEPDVILQAPMGNWEPKQLTITLGLG